jgi:hypothetical protein
MGISSSTQILIQQLLAASEAGKSETGAKIQQNCLAEILKQHGGSLDANLAH